MKKTVIIINGMGGAGKDTLCSLAAKHYKVKNISAITPIKEIARSYGWKGEKDSRSRKFLSDLKKVFIDYNDMPTNYLYGEYQGFLKGEEELLFVHIRESGEIDKFKALATDSACVTLLVEREGSGRKGHRGGWGNASDDEVKQYHYDYYYNNNKSLPETERDFLALLEKIRQEN